jgi:hypothetical protein
LTVIIDIPQCHQPRKVYTATQVLWLCFATSWETTYKLKTINFTIVSTLRGLLHCMWFTASFLLDLYEHLYSDS